MKYFKYAFNIKLKQAFMFLSSLWVALMSCSTSVMAADGNAITESAPFKGMMKLLNDAGVALLFAAPVLCGILVGIFSLIQACSPEPQDKDKWAKNKKMVLIVLCWVFGASGVVTLLVGYFQ